MEELGWWQGKDDQDSSGTHCCAALSAKCAVGGTAGWRLRKSSDGVVMIGMCLRTGGISGTAGTGREMSEMHGEKEAGLPM